MLGTAFANETKETLWAMYACWACILTLKMMSFAWFTGRLRVDRAVIHSDEDRRWMKRADVTLCPTGGGHPDVDRIRSAHRHDVEILVPWLLVLPVWLTSSPSFSLAGLLIFSFGFLNLLYTLVHMEYVGIRATWRTLLSAAEHFIVAYMCVTCALHYLS